MKFEDLKEGMWVCIAEDEAYYTPYKKGQLIQIQTLRPDSTIPCLADFLDSAGYVLKPEHVVPMECSAPNPDSPPPTGDPRIAERRELAARCYLAMLGNSAFVERPFEKDVVSAYAAADAFLNHQEVAANG